MNVNDIIDKNPLYVDVDGTLLIWPEPGFGYHQEGTIATINHDLVDVIKHYRKERPLFQVICWSANGEVYARRMLDEYGLTCLFDHILSKPGCLIDDSFDWFMLRQKIVVRNKTQDTRYFLRSE